MLTPSAFTKIDSGNSVLKQKYALKELRYFTEDVFAHIWSSDEQFENEEVRSLVRGFKSRVQRKDQNRLKYHFEKVVGNSVYVTSLLLRDYFSNFFLFIEVPSNFEQEFKLMWSHWLTNRSNVFVKVIDTLAVIANAVVHCDHYADFFLKPDEAVQWFMEWFEECLAADFYASGGWKKLREVCRECHEYIYRFVAKEYPETPHYEDTILDDTKMLHFIETSPLRCPVPQDCIPPDMLDRIDGIAFRRVVYLRCESEAKAEMNAFQTSNEILSGTDQSDKATSPIRKSTDSEEVSRKLGNTDVHNWNITGQCLLKKPTCISQEAFIPESSTNISVPEDKINVEESTVLSQEHTLKTTESCIDQPASFSKTSSNISFPAGKMNVEEVKALSHDQILDQPASILKSSSNIYFAEHKMNVEEAKALGQEQTFDQPAAISKSSSNISFPEHKMNIEEAKVLGEEQTLEVTDSSNAVWPNRKDKFRSSKYRIVKKFSQTMRNRYRSYYEDKMFDYNSCHLISKVYNNSLDKFLMECYTSDPEKKICIIGRYTIDSSSEEENNMLQLHDPDSVKLLLCDFKFAFLGQQ